MLGLAEVLLKAPLDLLAGQVVGDRTGLGETGEMLVIGADRLLRVDSVFDDYRRQPLLPHPD